MRHPGIWHVTNGPNPKVAQDVARVSNEACIGKPSPSTPSSPVTFDNTGLQGVIVIVVPTLDWVVQGVIVIVQPTLDWVVQGVIVLPTLDWVAQ